MWECLQLCALYLLLDIDKIRCHRAILIGSPFTGHNDSHSSVQS